MKELRIKTISSWDDELTSSHALGMSKIVSFLMPAVTSMKAALLMKLTEKKKKLTILVN